MRSVDIASWTASVAGPDCPFARPCIARRMQSDFHHGLSGCGEVVDAGNDGMKDNCRFCACSWATSCGGRTVCCRQMASCGWRQADANRVMQCEVYGRDAPLMRAARAAGWTRPESRAAGVVDERSPSRRQPRAGRGRAPGRVSPEQRRQHAAAIQRRGASGPRKRPAFAKASAGPP